MSGTRRNHGGHISSEQAKRNILLHCQKYDLTDFTRTINKSGLGYAAFPHYRFKAPQGAAFAVARIVREMTDKGELRYSAIGLRRGYYATWKGLKCLSDELNFKN